MWRYQKPGFGGLLLTELQRQQQGSRFCDTMLKTEDISIPAHSCVLSAISPHISSALSSTPSPPPGQSRLLEFQALGACTLLRVVRLIYSGEMAGEGGEEEKQEAVAAAAKLGIHGLVEVTAKGAESGRRAEAGVQTEPPSEKEGRRGRGVRDGGAVLWRERLAEGVKDTWTQTEQLQGSATAPESPFETIDLTCLQNMRPADPTAASPQIPFIPISLLYPPSETQIPQPSFAPLDALQESTAEALSVVMDLPPGFSSFLSREIATVANPWIAAAPPVAAGGDPGVEQFHGNISGYINSFLTAENQEAQTHRGRPRGRRKNPGARAVAGERRARRPSGRASGRGRGGLTETVAVQEVGVSAVQKLFLERWSLRSSRTGQGGGAVGRKLSLKARAIFSKNKRRGRGMKDLLLYEGGKAGAGGCNHTQDELSLSRAKAKSAAPGSFLSPPSRGESHRTALASTPSLRPAPSPGLWSSAGSYASPASSLLQHTPVASAPQDEQVEQIDRLLEEVMMGLDIFPNSGAQPVHQGGSSGAAYPAPARRENGRPGLSAVVKGGGPSGSADSKGPGPQQQRETEFREMLENFLSTFEREVSGCGGAEAAESQSRGQAGSSQTAERKAAGTQTPTRPQPPKAPAPPAAQPKRASTRKRSAPNRQQKGGARDERPKPEPKGPARPGERTLREVRERENQQLQQMPVVKLERTGTLPDRVILRRTGPPGLNGKSGKAGGGTWAVRRGSDEKDPTAWTDKKMYPIRSKIKDARVPLEQHRRRKGRPKNGDVLDASKKAGRAERRGARRELRNISGAPEEPSARAGADASEAPGKASRRKAEAEEGRSEDASASKRARLERTPRAAAHPSCGEAEEVIDVEAFSPSGGGWARGGGAESSQTNPGETGESSDGEDPENGIIDVVGDGGDGGNSALEGSGPVAHRVSVAPSASLGSEDEEEEDIDVDGENAPDGEQPPAVCAT